MTDAQHNALLQAFRAEVVNARTPKGSSVPNLKVEFKRRGLTDPEMDAIISEVNNTPLGW